MNALVRDDNDGRYRIQLFLHSIVYLPVANVALLISRRA